eukprot:CAMPEP_0202899226 /NCGR_PEP_ID=MMETSP1392-20130828/7515_1 /ASSEMBLY_ACC=CAM_ASM_000868 /TAXON_ID=225041 /ORGANISM="Chlamydomonas chlamydogama, Strain SAG 11-48b" /LENGTH=50 /DNA_ID=CAMNT_0049585349 /DNA_START=113 /DNA_END=262 /DNA_ORIENTATION=+
MCAIVQRTPLTAVLPSYSKHDAWQSNSTAHATPAPQPPQAAPPPPPPPPP